MSQQKIITTEDVSINTATIEVKVMKIGNRQVTLAVFRQLRTESIIDHKTGALRGIPWGKVNYHVGCEIAGAGTSHIHIVWQKGGELRRCYVVHPQMSFTDEYLATLEGMKHMQVYAQLEALDQLFIAV